MVAVDVESYYVSAPSSVLCVMQVASRDQLLDNQVYHEILEDFKQECNTIVSMEMPRPESPGSETVPGEGKIFLEFASVQDALDAKAKQLDGRHFNGIK